MLELQDWRLRHAVSPISHTFAAGRISVVLGANRSGKSALLRSLAGLEDPVAGTLRLNGSVLEKPRQRSEQAALVYQSFINYPHWTVFENVASPMRTRGLDESALQNKVQDLARRLGLDELLQRKPGELSGGQQQRLAIARALAKEAPVLLLDEPLVNLDFKLREQLRGELRGLLNGSETEVEPVVLLTSSDPVDAFELADEVLVLEEGALLQSGEALEVYRGPLSPTAANLMSEPAVNWLVGESSLVGVRPEHLTIDAAAGDRRFSLTLQGYETNGFETFLHGDCEGRSWTARLPGMHSFESADSVELYARSSDLLEFPAP